VTFYEILKNTKKFWDLEPETKISAAFHRQSFLNTVPGQSD
jgi:hypothetical protein